MKGTRPLDNDEIRSVSTCFAEVVSPTQFCLGTFTAKCLKNNFRFELGGVAQSWFRGWSEFPMAVHGSGLLLYIILIFYSYV